VWTFSARDCRTKWTGQKTRQQPTPIQRHVILLTCFGIFRAACDSAAKLASTDDDFTIGKRQGSFELLQDHQ
jgi:hypothetical protein